MHARRLLTAALLWLAWPAMALADIAVIVHPDSPVRMLNVREVSDLYLGRTRGLGSGDSRISIIILEHPADSPLREAFFRTLNGMSMRQVNAYWARLRFSGEVLPPTALQDNRAIIEAVARNRNALSYVDAAALNDSVRAVLILKE